MEKITLSTQLINAVLGYLGTRPYQEVFTLIDALQKEAQNQSKEEDGKPDAN